MSLHPSDDGGHDLAVCSFSVTLFSFNVTNCIKNDTKSCRQNVKIPGHCPKSLRFSHLDTNLCKRFPRSAPKKFKRVEKQPKCGENMEKMCIFCGEDSKKSLGFARIDIEFC